MTYDETVQYLFNCAPPFQQVGGAAYKEGLSTTIALDGHLGNPHKKFITIHIAGTNGKGSTSNMLTSALAAAGYKVGLYTSPHILVHAPASISLLICVSSAHAVQNIYQ